MKTWMKVALGCFAVSVIGVFILVAAVVGFGYWAKGKVQEVAEGGPAVQEARRAANAVPFTRPAGGIIPEDRLARYIEVRASVYSVYEKYRGEIDSRMAKVKDKNSVDLGDISTGFTLISELQRAELTALAKHGMSEREYGFITGEVMKAMWAKGGKGEAIGDAAEAARTAAADAVRGLQDGARALPPEAREALAQAQEGIAAGATGASEGMEELEVAPENLALFKKYEEDLKKYAMPGLNMFFKPDPDSTPDAVASPPTAR